MKSQKPNQQARKRKQKNLNSTLYCYVEDENKKFAKTKGASQYGSHSAYINALIAKDRNVKAKPGYWKAKVSE